VQHGLTKRSLEVRFSEVRLKLTHYCGNSSFSSSITSLRLSSISKEKRTTASSLPRDLEVESLIVVVEERFLEEPLL
jgi:hypothetical protein